MGKSVKGWFWAVKCKIGLFQLLVGIITGFNDNQTKTPLYYLRAFGSAMAHSSNIFVSDLKRLANLDKLLKEFSSLYKNNKSE